MPVAHMATEQFATIKHQNREEGRDLAKMSRRQLEYESKALRAVFSVYAESRQIKEKKSAFTSRAGSRLTTGRGCWVSSLPRVRRDGVET